jgi:hypothetical protein
VTFAPLQLGKNYVSGNLNVKCNASYEVDVVDKNPLTAWHMTEWTGAAYKAGGYRLHNPLQVISAQNDVTAGTPATLVVGTLSGQTPDSGQNFNLTYEQTLRNTDAALPIGETYHLVLTYVAYITV